MVGNENWQQFARDVPVHVTRQLPNGKWTSKLGSYEDVEHETLQGLTGTHPAYGSVVCYMAKVMRKG